MYVLGLLALLCEYRTNLKFEDEILISQVMFIFSFRHKFLLTNLL